MYSERFRPNFKFLFGLQTRRLFCILLVEIDFLGRDRGPLRILNQWRRNTAAVR